MVLPVVVVPGTVVVVAAEDVVLAGTVVCVVARDSEVELLPSPWPDPCPCPWPVPR
jgi:hypothetical protein